MIRAGGTLTDGTRTIKLYTMTDFEHTADMLMVYLPMEKILAEAVELGRQAGRATAAAH